AAPGWRGGRPRIGPGRLLYVGPGLPWRPGPPVLPGATRPPPAPAKSNNNPRNRTMNLPRLRHSLAVILIALLAPLASAGDDSVHTMAGILIKLNHFPSAEEKATLQAIIASPDSSAATKAIAQAIHDMQHSVSAADKAKLEAIASDP